MCVVDPDDVGVEGGKDDEFADGSGAIKLDIHGEGSGGDGGVEGAGLGVVNPDDVGVVGGKDDKVADSGRGSECECDTEEVKPPKAQQQQQASAGVLRESQNIYAGRGLGAELACLNRTSRDEARMPMVQKSSSEGGLLLPRRSSAAGDCENEGDIVARCQCRPAMVITPCSP